MRASTRPRECRQLVARRTATVRERRGTARRRPLTAGPGAARAGCGTKHPAALAWWTSDRSGSGSIAGRDSRRPGGRAQSPGVAARSRPRRRGSTGYAAQRWIVVLRRGLHLVARGRRIALDRTRRDGHDRRLRRLAAAGLPTVPGATPTNEVTPTEPRRAWPVATSKTNPRTSSRCGSQGSRGPGHRRTHVRVDIGEAGHVPRRLPARTRRATRPEMPRRRSRASRTRCGARARSRGCRVAAG